MRTELSILLERLYETYGKKPIIYVTEESYDLFIKGHFEGYRLWVRDIFSEPNVDKYDFVLWQYSNRGRLKGYHGSEKFIDLDAFNGSKEEFEEFCK